MRGSTETEITPSRAIDTFIPGTESKSCMRAIGKSPARDYPVSALFPDVSFPTPHSRGARMVPAMSGRIIRLTGAKRRVALLGCL